MVKMKIASQNCKSNFLFLSMSYIPLLKNFPCAESRQNAEKKREKKNVWEPSDFINEKEVR